MTKDEIDDLAQEIQKQKKKNISLAYEKSKKLLQSMHKHSKKVKEGCKKIIEETEPKLTEEGMKKIKFRSQFDSLKAINALVHFIDDQFSNFKIPDPSRKMTSIELNQFIRLVSRLINEINREQSVTNSIMGIDFMLKKRTVYTPLSKLGSELTALRNLQKEEYSIIKALEVLSSLSTDVKDLSQKTLEAKDDASHLEDEYKQLEEAKKEAEKENDSLLEHYLIKDSRNRGIRMTELEIDIGRHLNSFKKIFKKYAREVQRGSFSGEFGIVNTALAYEKNPVQSLLKEEESNPEITELLVELIKVGKSDLHLKQKNINNLNHELNILQQGKMDSKKQEWKDLLTQKKEVEESSEFKSIKEKLDQSEKKIIALKTKLDEKEEEINLNKKKLTQLTESQSERHQRASEVSTEVLNPEE